MMWAAVASDIIIVFDCRIMLMYVVVWFSLQFSKTTCRCRSGQKLIWDIWERQIFSETTVAMALRAHDQEAQLWLQDVASAACEWPKWPHVYSCIPLCSSLLTALLKLVAICPCHLSKLWHQWRQWRRWRPWRRWKQWRRWRRWKRWNRWRRPLRRRHPQWRPWRRWKRWRPWRRWRPWSERSSDGIAGTAWVTLLKWDCNGRSLCRSWLQAVQKKGVL